MKIKLFIFILFIHLSLEKNVFAFFPRSHLSLSRHLSSIRSLFKPSIFLKRWNISNHQIYFSSQDRLNIILRKRKENSYLRLAPSSIFQWIDFHKQYTHSLSSRELAQNIWALSHLGENIDPSFFPAWYYNANHRINEFTSQEFAKSLWALAVIHSQHQLPNILDRTWFLRALFELEQKSDFNQIEAHQIFLFLQYLDVSVKDPIQISDTLQVRLRLKLEENKLSNSPVTSKFQDSVGEHLHRLFREVEEEYWVKTTETPVDFYIPEKNLIIQVDGPHHFFVKSDGVKHLNPKDILLGRILTDSGFSLIRISYKEWAKLKSTLDQERFLTDLIHN